MKRLLFMCPHGAAKSVLAAAYARQLAMERGLDLDIVCAGTDPDAETAAAVLHLLRTEGIDVSDHVPRRATAEELSQADLVISMGCDLADLVPPGRAIMHWDDVPAPSQALLAARESILQKVASFLDTLVVSGGVQPDCKSTAYP